MAFSKKKSNDVVKPLFTWNNSFNLKNEHSNSIEQNRNKNRNIFYSILCILLIQIRQCKQFQRHSVVPGPPIPSLLVICFLFFFSIPQTYLISRNAFDTKRKKKRGGGWPNGSKASLREKTVFFSALIWTELWRMFLDFLFIRFPFCFSLLELSVHTLKTLFFRRTPQNI